MTIKTDGGPAYPATVRETFGDTGLVKIEQVPGMSLRDWFAGLVLQGICASGPGSEWGNARLAREAYQLADAMIKEREKT